MVFTNSLSSYYEKFLATGEVKCIDEEIPFEIPQGWEWERIGNVFFVTKLAGFEYTKFFTKEALSASNPIPIVRAQNVRMGFFEENKNEAISEMLSNQLERSALNKKCLLMTFIGAGIGDTCIFPAERKNHLAPNVAKIEPLDDSISLDYAVFALMSPCGQRGVNAIKKSTAQPSLSMETIRKLLIPIPPLKEQKCISLKLSEALPLVEKYSKVQEEQNQLNVEIQYLLKKSILQEAIQGKLVPQIAEEGTAQELLEQIKTEKEKLVKDGKLKKSALTDSVIFKGDDNKYFEKIGTIEKDITDEIPFEIPNSWCWIRLNNLCNITNGFTPLRTEPKFWENGNINWFTVEDIRKQGEYIYQTTQKITELAVSKDRIVRAGSVLLCCTASVGQCAMTMIPTTTNQQFNALTIKEEYRCLVNDEFLYLFVKTLAPILHDLAGKTTFEFISVKKVGNILVPIPPVLEQCRICKVTNKAIASIMRG